jgi:hypothetical protein
MSEPIYQIWITHDYPSRWEDVPLEEFQRVKNPDDKRVLYESEYVQSELADYKTALDLLYAAQSELAALRAENEETKKEFCTAWAEVSQIKVENEALHKCFNMQNFELEMLKAELQTLKVQKPNPSTPHQRIKHE